MENRVTLLCGSPFLKLMLFYGSAAKQLHLKELFENDLSTDEYMKWLVR
jgi:hypothetical protein